MTREADRHQVRFTGDPVARGRHTLPEPATVPPTDDDAALGGPNGPSGEPGAGRGAPDAVLAVVARHESEGSTRACACGCGRPVPVPGSGPPRRYATAACRAAVYRRHRAEVPLDLPRQPNDHGRRRLAATQRT